MIRIAVFNSSVLYKTSYTVYNHQVCNAPKGRLHSTWILYALLTSLSSSPCVQYPTAAEYGDLYDYYEGATPTATDEYSEPQVNNAGNVWCVYVNHEVATPPFLVLCTIHGQKYVVWADRCVGQSRRSTAVSWWRPVMLTSHRALWYTLYYWKCLFKEIIWLYARV